MIEHSYIPEHMLDDIEFMEYRMERLFGKESEEVETLHPKLVDLLPTNDKE